MRLRGAIENCVGSARVVARRAGRLAGRIFPNSCGAWPAALLLFCQPDLSSAAAQTAIAAVVTHTTTNAVSPDQLSQSIDRVLQQREFAWRMPRDKPAASEAEQGWLARAVEFVVETARDAVQAAVHGIGQSLKWIGKMLLKLWPQSTPRQPGLAGVGSQLIYFLQILLLLLISVLVGFLAVLVFRAYHRRRQPNVVLAEPVAARPDLTHDEVTADQLPEDGWLNLAREMMEQGNLRLALRALYLASLAHLASRELISIAIFKSNREYETELRRRARALPGVQDAFSQNVAAFDRAWYGLHVVTQDALHEFQSNLARIRAC
ncbi:MAG: DUF4129 domain-containing protein [Verrucomicrobiota bacterium]